MTGIAIEAIVLVSCVFQGISLRWSVDPQWEGRSCHEGSRSKQSPYVLQGPRLTAIGYFRLLRCLKVQRKEVLEGSERLSRTLDVCKCSFSLHLNRSEDKL